MAIATYAELQTAMANWLARSDLTSYLPDFIVLFEAAAARRLRVRPMEISTTLTPSSGIAALPADYLSWRSVIWTGSNRVGLSYVHPTYLESAYPTSPSDTPAIFTIAGSTSGQVLKVRPIDDTGLAFDYYAKNAALSGTLNWLFTNYPDIYLFGSLAEAQGFNVDFEKLAFWKTRRDEIFDEIEKMSFREAGALSIRTVGPVI